MWGQKMPNRSSRIQTLADAVADYAGKEKTRIENEVKALQEILDRRGANVQAATTRAVAAVANNDLQAYLEK